MGAQPAGDDRARGEGNRETWRDWLPPGAPEAAPLLTRGDLLLRLQDEGIAATERDLRYWEREEILPRPIKQWHEGAVRALYPPWVTNLIRELRRLQAEGLSLAEIAPRLRDPETIFAFRARPPLPPEEQEALRESGLAEALGKLARYYEERDDAQLYMIQIRLHGLHGKRYDHTFTPVRNMAAPERADDSDFSNV